MYLLYESLLSSLFSWIYSYPQYERLELCLAVSLYEEYSAKNGRIFV